MTVVYALHMLGDFVSAAEYKRLHSFPICINLYSIKSLNKFVLCDILTSASLSPLIPALGVPFYLRPQTQGSVLLGLGIHMWM